jgi:hypothetical protein
MEKELLESISAKLTCIISLLMKESDSSGDSTKGERAADLHRFGLSNNEIALILGSTERSIQELIRQGKASAKRK